MKRLIVVFNSKSSRSIIAQREISEKARKLPGFLVGKYEVLPTNVDDNALKLSKILQDGDLVVAVGGDATASIGMNGCLLSGKDVVFSALSFGNFGDVAHYFGNLEFSEVIERFGRKETREFYPIDVRVDGEHFRYAAGYATVGMMAESVEIFNQEKNRNKMKKKKRTEFSSYRWLAKWYFKNRKKEFLPNQVSDYFAINGKNIAKIMKGGDFGFSQEFQRGEYKLAGFFSLCWFMARAILSHIYGETKKKDELVFPEKRALTIQMEGESKDFVCQKIEFLKNKTIKVISK